LILINQLWISWPTNQSCASIFPALARPWRIYTSSSKDGKGVAVFGLVAPLVETSRLYIDWVRANRL
jgi:hypothetical protein